MSVGGRVYRAMCADLPGVGHAVPLDDGERHHLVRVRRVGQGASVQVLDGAGGIGRATFDGEEFVLDSVDRVPSLPSVELAVAVPKGDRFDWVVEKCTEIGVASIVALETERGRPRPSDKRVERWRRIAVAAVKQSGQPYLPLIAAPVSVEEWLGATAAKTILVADHGSDAVPLASTGATLHPPVSILIGPEGGLTPEERGRAVAAGGRVVHLGRAVLRIETAAIVASALLLDALGGLRTDG